MMRVLLMVAVLMLLVPTAQAGILVSPSAHWRTFSFEEGETPITPNYYGVGGALNLGYSIDQTFDIGAYLDYTPATLTNVKPGKADAILASFAGQLAVRLAESVFVAGRFGQQLYNVLKRQRPEDEIDGRWAGTFYGLSLGALFLVEKTTSWQISLDGNRATLERVDQSGFSARKLDSFSVSLSFVFNSRPGGSNFLGGFLKSVGY